MNSKNNAAYVYFYHFALLAVLISVCYSGSLDNSWHFDDIPNIVENKNVHIHELSWSAIVKSCYSSLYKGQISRPIANLSIALNYYFSGLDTTGYHLFNISIHIVCAIFVYLVFLETVLIFRSKSDEDFITIFSAQDIALLGAMLWALHPIHTQAVTYIVQRMASMASMFYMIAMYCYLRFRLSQGVRAKVFYIFIMFFFWMFAVFTKENTVLLPLALIGYEVAFLGTSIRKYFKYFALFLAVFLSVILLLATLSSESNIWEIISSGYSVRPFTMWQRVITEPIILMRYLFLLFMPVSDFLTVETDIVASKYLWQPLVTLPANIFILFLVVTSIVYLRRYPMICYALLFYFINHIVESSIIGLELYFEHRNYLPSIFIYMALSYYMLKGVMYYRKQSKMLMQGLLVTTLGVFLISEGNATYLRNEVWKNGTTLWTDTAEKAPMNLRVLISLHASYTGDLEHDRELLGRAEKLYQQNPGRYQKSWIADLYYNAGIMFSKMGTREDERKAIKLFYKSIQMDPMHADYRNYVNLGILFLKQGDFTRAEKALANALALEDGVAAIYNAYGRALYANNKTDGAIRIFERGLQVSDLPELRLNLAALNVRKGNLSQADRVLTQMNYGANQPAFLLLLSLVKGGEYRQYYLDRIAEFLYTNNIDYSDWISSVTTNQSPGIIYPDIVSVENELKQKYVDVLRRAERKLDMARKGVLNCELTLNDH